MTGGEGFMLRSVLWLRRGLLAGSVVLVAACGGGGGGSGTPPFGGGGGGGGGSGGGGVTASDLDITAPATIVNSGTETVTVTVTSLTAARVALPGAAVTLSADNGGILTLGSTTGVTGADGRLTATLAIGSNRANRTITVTATSGEVRRTAAVAVVTSPAAAQPASIELIASATTVGTGGDEVTVRAFVKDTTNNTLPGTPVSFTATTGTIGARSLVTDAAGVATAVFTAGADRSNRNAEITVSAGTVQGKLSLPISGTKLTASGANALILGRTATFTVVAVDSKGNALPGVPTSATSSLGNGLVPLGGTSTDANGQVSYTYTASIAGTDTVTFRGANASISPPVVVSGDDFSFVSPAAASIVSVNTLQEVQVRFRQGGVAQAGRTVNFAATGGNLSAPTSVTDASGIARVSISSAFAGPLTVQATVSGTTTSSTLPLAIVATVPSRLVLQITPTALAPNTVGTSGSQAQVIAKVTDATGNPVQGQTVNFSRVTDPSGGNLGQASAVTDANGQASVPYIAGAESTADNGVQLRGVVASAPAVSGVASLTVNQRALFITLGTGNVIGSLDPQTYKKDWVVYVTDANGIAVSGVTLTMKVLPLFYRRGNLTFLDPSWVYQAVGPNLVRYQSCPSEDVNANGILEAGEDTNGNGVLTPGNVVAVSPGSVQTDASGRATISLIYAESFAPWVDVRLTASATVAGTESRRDAEFVLVGSAEDFSDETNAPAGVISPFGLFSPAAAAYCANVQ